MKKLLAALIGLVLLPSLSYAQIATLNGTTESVTVVLSGAKTTVDATYQLLWDGNGGPKVESGTTNGVTAVAALTGVANAPPASVNSFILYNSDTGAITATVNKKVGSTSYPIAKLTLQVSDVVTITKDGTIRIIDTNGQAKSVASANLVTLPVGASTIALGTNSGTAAVLPAGTAALYPTTAADDTVGVRVHATDQVTGRLIHVGNGVSNKILKVYAPTGGTINGAAADAAFSSASGKGVIICCLNSSGNTWLAW